MDINSVSSVTTQVATASNYNTKSADSTSESKKSESTGFSKSAAVYEKSSKTSDAKTAENSKKASDRTAIVAQMKADMEAQKSQLLDIVRKSISGQGKAYAQANNDDSLWKKLANGEFTVDEATRAQAQADIADDGYWGVEQTSDRILDFAKALSGNNPDKAEELLNAFKKGYKEATKSWGKDLPDISSRTYDRVLEKFDDWKNGTEA